MWKVNLIILKTLIQTLVSEIWLEIIHLVQLMNVNEFKVRLKSIIK